MEPHTGKSFFLYGLKRPASFFDHYETRQKLHPPLGKDSATLVSYRSQQRHQLGAASPGNPLMVLPTQEYAVSGGEALLNVPTNDPEACGWDA